MNAMTREAVEWLIKQPEFMLERNDLVCAIDIAGEQFTDRNAEDAICAAYEALHVKPALADERTTLPDYGNHA